MKYIRTENGWSLPRQHGISAMFVYLTAVFFVASASLNG